MTTPSNLIPVHPVQQVRCPSRASSESAVVPQVVTLSAYEVYKEVYGEQKAMIEGHCRGGFSTGELIAFLYAKNFPRDQWNKRVDEAFRGMKL